MEYRLTTHVGSGPVQHSLERDRMVVVFEKSGRRDEVPFADVREINLRQELPGAFSVRVVRRTGATITIPSRHFERAGQFEDRGTDYLAFVTRLHDVARAANPGIAFVGGSSGLYWLGWFFMVCGDVIGALLAYALIKGGEHAPRPRLFIGVAVMFLVGAAFIRQGRAKPYDPRELPAKLLPTQS